MVAARTILDTVRRIQNEKKEVDFYGSIDNDARRLASWHHRSSNLFFGMENEINGPDLNSILNVGGSGVGVLPQWQVQRRKHGMKQYIKTIITLGSAAGAIMAIAAFWASFGFPTLATGSDIKRLDRVQAEAAVEIYQTKTRSLLVISPPDGTPAYNAWKEELNHARDQLKRAEDRKIELAK